MRREKEGREGRKGGGTRVTHERPCSHTTPPAEPPSCCQPGIDPTTDRRSSGLPRKHPSVYPRFLPQTCFSRPKIYPPPPLFEGRISRREGNKNFSIEKLDGDRYFPLFYFIFELRNSRMLKLLMEIIGWIYLSLFIGQKKINNDQE